MDAAATVKNVGSLWLKCTISFANVQTTGESDITKVLNVHKLPVGAASVEEGEYLGTMNELMADGKFIVGDGEGILAPQDVAGDGYPATDSFILVIKMQEKAGNEYQDCGVSFDVFVNATQYNHEEDGFGNDQYDKDAVYKQVNVDYDENKTRQENGDALKDAIENAPDDAVIYVEGGFYDVTPGAGEEQSNLKIDRDNVTIVGSGNRQTSIEAHKTGESGDVQQTVLITGDNVTLKNLTISYVTGYDNKTLEIRGGDNAVIENCMIGSHEGTAVYIGETGAANYTVRGNTIVGDLCITNGAGNEGTTRIIEGNTFAGSAILLNGKGQSGGSYAWMQHDLTALPIITGNTFTQPAGDSAFPGSMQYYLRSLSYKNEGAPAEEQGVGPMEMVPQSYVDEFVKNNTFTQNQDFTYGLSSSDPARAFYGIGF